MKTPKGMNLRRRFAQLTLIGFGLLPLILFGLIVYMFITHPPVIRWTDCIFSIAFVVALGLIYLVIGWAARLFNWALENARRTEDER